MSAATDLDALLTVSNLASFCHPADKRDERDKKRDDIANGAASGTAGGPGTLPVRVAQQRTCSIEHEQKVHNGSTG